MGEIIYKSIYGNWQPQGIKTIKYLIYQVLTGHLGNLPGTINTTPDVIESKNMSSQQWLVK